MSDDTASLYLKVTLAESKSSWDNETRYTLTAVLQRRNTSMQWESMGYGADNKALEHLQYLVCAGEKDLLREGIDSLCYGHLDMHNCHSVDVADAEAMVKLFHRVQGRLARLAKEDGDTENVAHYLLRLGKVLGACGMLFDASPEYLDVTGNKERVTSLAEGASHIKHMIYDAKRKADNASAA